MDNYRLSTRDRHERKDYFTNQCDTEYREVRYYQNCSMFALICAIQVDLMKTGLWTPWHNGIRIITRLSENENLSSNGGDYQFYVDYFVADDGRIHREEGWSADFYYDDWNHYTRTVYGVGSKAGLQAICRKFDYLGEMAITRRQERLSKK